MRSGVNYAPLQPLLNLTQSPGQSHYLCDALKERYRHFWQQDSTVWRELGTAAEMIAHFLAGDQLIERDPFSGGWLVIKPQRQDAASARALNLMQYYVTNCMTKWLQSNPDVVAKAARDDDRAVSAAKGADIIVDHYEAKFYKAWFSLQEGLQALTFGTYINRLRYDAGIKGVIGMREIIENRTVQFGEGAGYCGDCGKTDVASAFPQDPEQGAACPQCGSNAVLVDSPPTEEIPSVVGQEAVELGDLVLETLPLIACRFDLATRAEWSDFFLYQRRVNLGAIRRLLGPVKLPAGDFAGSTDLSDTILRGISHMGQAVSGGSNVPWRSASTSQDQVALCEMWLSPDHYSDIKLKGDEQTVSGETLPTWASLADLFPDGLVAVGLNGFATTLGVYAEKHSDSITSGVWHMKPISGTGRGMTDVVEVQKRFNKLDSQQLAYMDAVATPATLFDETLLDNDEAGYLGSPRANIPVSLAQLPETRSLAQSVLQLPPGSVPGQFVQYAQQFLTQAFSTTSHVTDFTNGGIAGQRNDTARAAMIADANANSVFGPILAVKGETRQRIAEMVVEKYREHFPIKRYFPLGGEYSQQSGVWLSSADLGGDVRFDVVRESELPQNSISKQDKIISFFQLFGGFPMYQQAMMTAPDLVTDLAKLWNVDVQGAGFDVTAQLCRRRLEQIKQAYQVASAQAQAMGAIAQSAPPQDGMASPEAAAMQPMGVPPDVLLQAIQPPISPMEPAHMDKAKWLQKFLDEDEALAFPLDLRATLELWIQTHFQLAGMQQMALASQATQIQMAGGGPHPEPDGDEATSDESPKSEAKEPPSQHGAPPPRK